LPEHKKGHRCSICDEGRIWKKWTDFEQVTKYLCVNCLNLLSVMEGQEEEA
jgi:hypothetical protein